MEDDKNNDEVDNSNKDDDTKAKQQLEKLNEYVQQMAYKPVEPPQASERTEALAKAPKKYILGTYADHKDNFQPKERSERIEKIVQNHTPMTTENLEDFIRKYRKKQAQQEKKKKQQQIKYHETLLKLQKQCENQLMNAIVHKFAEVVSKKASSIKLPSWSSPSSSNVETESYQRLQNSLVCDMIFSLKIPNIQQSSDFSIYKKLATVLADLILQALFLAHKSDYDEQKCAGGDHEQLEANSNERDLELKLRALQAAKKLHNQSRKKSSKGYAVLSHCLNK